MALMAGRVGVRRDQVDGQGYITGSGGGGGTKNVVFKRYVLGNSLTNGLMSLADSYKNYDLLELVGTVTYQGVKYHISGFYSPDDLIIGEGFGSYSDGNALGFKVNSETEIQLAVNTFGEGTQIVFAGYKIEKEV